MGVLDDENADRKSSSSSKASSSTSSKSSSSSGLNSAGNRGSGAGPGASANRSTSSASSRSSGTPSSSDRPSNSRTGTVGADRREIDRSLNASSDRNLNSSGNRATGAGPMSSANRETTSTGFTPSGRTAHAAERGIDRSLGARTTPATPTGGLMTSARATELKSMQDYDTYRQADLASKARASENASMASLQAVRDALLDTIAGTEAPDYATVYGGGKFTNFDDHPRQGVTIQSGPNKGKVSTAAGRYQFLGSTWDQQKAKLDLPDFSPASQDAAAYDLAKSAYQKATGKSLDAALAAGDAKTIAEVGKALSGTWTSLPGGIEQSTSGTKFANDFQRNLDKRNGKSTEADLPSTVAQVPSTRPSTDRFASTYLGGSATNGGLSPKQVADYRDYGLNRSYAPVDPISRVASTQPAQHAPASSYKRDSVVIAGDTTPKAQPEVKSGNPVVAGGIDVLLGAIPGVGAAASIVNAGLSLTGNKTIGQRIADDFANGGGKNGSVLMAREGSDRSEPRKKPADQKITSPTPARFEDTYLAFVDPVSRPTPAQKWGGIGIG